MMDCISPKYRMKLLEQIKQAIWNEYASYEKAALYISQWHVRDEWTENFSILRNSKGIDVLQTLNNIDNETLIKIAIDLGIETPDFIPSVPLFRNKIKAEYPTASATFEKAIKAIETDPDTAIGLANSALESIVKEILRHPYIHSNKDVKKDTLHSLVCSLLKVFKLFPGENMPTEFNTIGSSLISIAKSIEGVRSERTNFHGKCNDDVVISDSMYAYMVVNSVTTVGLFLDSFFKKYIKDTSIEAEEQVVDDLPF